MGDIIMKNIQVIDAADNCAYDVFQATDREFEIIFPSASQDIQFAEDLPNTSEVNEALNSIWQRLYYNKKDINGIHGTLFYQLIDKKAYYPNKRESDLTTGGGRRAMK